MWPTNYYVEDFFYIVRINSNVKQTRLFVDNFSLIESYQTNNLLVYKSFKLYIMTHVHKSYYYYEMNFKNILPLFGSSLEGSQ